MNRSRHLIGRSAFVLLVLLSFFSFKSYGTISITTASTSICTNYAASGGRTPQWTTLGTITLTENANADMGGVNGSWSVTLIVSAPTGWQFNSTVAPTVGFTSGKNISSATLGTYTSSSMTITIAGSNKNKKDVLTITGLQVQPTTTSAATGNIAPSSVTGTITGVAIGTNFATLTPASPSAGTASVAIAVAPSSTICATSTATFTATPTNGGTTPQYQWKLNGSNISGATNSTYTTSSLVNGDNILCTMIGNSCITSPTATSTAIGMTVNAIPNITNFTSTTATSPCAGSASTTTVNSTSLGAGTFTATYSLTGANVFTGHTASLSMGASNGTFTIPGTDLATAGSTSVTITSITNTIGCSSTVSTNNRAAFTVNIQPAAITGTTNVCTGSTRTLSNGTAGGTWTTSNTSIATVSTSTRVVTPVSAGSVNISYTMAAGCYSVAPFTVYQAPSTILGNSSICTGTTGTLSDAVTGGTWSSSATFRATIDVNTGFLTPVSAGTTTITYAMPGSCTTTTVVTVNSSPVAITGTTNVCTGATRVLSDGTTGGTWTTSNTTIATVATATRTFSGVSAGSVIISYTLSTGCFDTSTFTVYQSPSTVLGTASVCTGRNITMSDAVTGGTWSSVTTTVATIDPSSGLVTPVAAGTSIISYTMPGSCATTTVVTVNSSPAAITGTNFMCTAATTTLSDATASGTWTSSNTTIATISTTTRVVSGVAAGTAIISYTLASGCNDTVLVTVKTTPGAISGASNVCSGSPVTFSDAANYGTWTSGNTTIATVGQTTGVVTGVASGTTNISYSTGCGGTVTKSVTTGSSPILGTLSVCTSATTGLSDASTGGTWTSGTTSVATVGLSNGIVSGVSAGTSVISYITSSCTTVATVTVIGTPAAISNPSSVCIGSNTILSDATTNGTWTSSNTNIVTIGSSSGAVTSVTTGTVTITYATGCGSAATKTFTVNPVPGAIGGTTVICAGSTSTLTNATAGGTWSSSTSSVATIGSSSRVVTGVTAGNTTITYSLGTGCAATTSLTVNPLPSGITGTTSVCAGLTTNISDISAAGTWSSTNSTVATVDPSTGSVSGVTAGSTTISYTISTGCAATTTVTVNPLPAAIGGTVSVCEGAATNLTDATAGGTWVSSTTSVATIGSGSGIVSGSVAGSTTITYTLPTGCLITTPLTVNPTPGDISGITTVCAGSTTTLSDATIAGTWSSSNSALATVDNGTGVVTGVSSGSPTISYSLATGCFAATAITVNPLPSAGTITGATTLCDGNISPLSDAVAGGTWSSDNTAIATIDASGVVNVQDAGSVNIIYAVTNSCGTASVTAALTINPVPDAGFFSSNTIICRGGTTTLTTGSPGGIWTSSNTTVATVGSSTGTVTGINSGTTTISYTISSGCGSDENDTTFTVNALPTAAPTNNGPICIGGTVTLTANPSGGASNYTWSGSNLASTTAQNPTATPTATSIYSLTVTNGSGYPGCSPTTIYTTTVSVNSNSWLGTISTDWYTAGNWCGGVPTTIMNVTVPSGVTYYPLITAGTASAKDITINSGAKLTVTGGTLQISGNISTVGTFSVTGGTIEMNGASAQTIPASSFASNTINNLTVSNSAGVTLSGTLNIQGAVKASTGNLTTGGYLTLLSTATQTALIDGSGAGSVVGNTTMQRYLAHSYGYKYVSTPFTSTTVGNFSSYINLSATFPAFYSNNENLSTAGWVVDTVRTNTLSTLLGYAGNFGTSSSPVTFSLTGSVNNGALSTTLYNHNNTFTLGYNLVGNPYPSPIDWTASSGWTKTNIDNAVYYFNASDTNQYTGTYSTYISGVSSDGIASNIIPAMQGFFVHVTNGTYPVTATLGLNNSVRVTNLNPTFHKTAATQDPSMIRLDATFANDGTHSDPAVIYFDENANGTFDNTLDALKLMNTDDGVPNLYSIAPDATNLSIQALNPASDSINIIPLGLKTEHDGQITFNARDIVNMPSGMHIYFYDTKTSTSQDLLIQPKYHVNLSKGKYDNRFFLMFTNKDKGSLPVVNGALNAYTSGNSLFVYVISGKGDLVITDLLGRVIERQELNGNGYHEIKLKVSTGMYIAALYSTLGKQSKKIFIGN